LLGATLTINIIDGDVMVTPTEGPMAKVISADILADNGVVHLIDTVLLPSAAEGEVETLAAPTAE